jgi:hypothetical protein
MARREWLPADPRADGTRHASQGGFEEGIDAMPNTFENVVAKVTGKAAAVEARMRGLKGVFNRLAEQHHEVGSLLSRAEAADDPSSRAGLWRQIRKQLVAHEQGELLEIYPVLAGYERTREIALAHSNHASELEELISEVDALAPQSAEWKPALMRLIETVKEHVELEETQFFPAAQEAMGEEAARLLEKPFLDAEQMALNKLAG